MRVPMKFLLAAALVVPAGAVTSNAVNAGAAPAGTKCTKTSGTATFKPALPKSGSTVKVKPKITVKKGKLSGCTGGGVKSGTIKLVAKFRTGTNCDTLLAGNPSPKPPTGTIDTTWNTGQTSKASVTLNAVSGQPTQTHITGTVTAGLFNGLDIDGTISFVPKTGDCLTTDLSAVTFQQVTNLTIS